MTPSNYKYGSISSHDDPEPGDEIKHDSASCTCLAKLRRWNWKNITTISCLWLAYLLCNMSYSIVGPFFPDEVHIAKLCKGDFGKAETHHHDIVAFGTFQGPPGILNCMRPMISSTLNFYTRNSHTHNVIATAVYEGS